MNKLPEPDAAGKKHSAKLCARIRRRIARGGGRISFAQFMEDALYAPELGYYAAGVAKFGADGDFTTAPQLGGVIARCLAVQCAEAFAELELTDGDLLEFGAGSGQLAADLLAAMDALNATPRRYLIVETSAALRERQRETIASRGYEERVRWLEHAPREFCGIVFANELLDAMPAARFEMNARGRACELGVCVDAAGNFAWSRGEELPEELQRRIKLHEEETGAALADGYRGEIGLRAEKWVRDTGARIKRGALLLLDYGYPRREFYHAERRDGTLMCHYRHFAHADPFFYPGLQDISAHIDFTAIRDAAHETGLATAGFASQGAFLLSLGALDVLAESHDNDGDLRGQIARAHEVRTLTMPQGMGELVKVIAFAKNCALQLRGFQLRDRSGRL
ncbi:MAG: SAM-dependent methyltransferase [Gammaproteobacteria bacterium]|nr:SAM-dependent methyltransferase [Gammaproteobacteria bacterium]